MIFATANLESDLIIQYSIVCLILLAAIVWIIMKIVKKNKTRQSGCCGCTIAETCKKKKLKFIDENSQNLQRPHRRESDC